MTATDQQDAFDAHYHERMSGQGPAMVGHFLWVRERRRRIATDKVLEMLGTDPSKLSALVVCGGSGTEASYLLERGFGSVTNSDFSAAALESTTARDPRLKTFEMNLDTDEAAVETHDVVVVHDGLHHLKGPVQGFNKMLTMASRAAIVMEPAVSMIGRMIGTDWETVGDTTNYVFRWNDQIFGQTVRSQLVRDPSAIWTTRIWDHNMAVSKLSNWTESEAIKMGITRATYGMLSPVNRFGNNFIGIAVK